MTRARALAALVIAGVTGFVLGAAAAARARRRAGGPVAPTVAAGRITAEQAALRRVATLVARGVAAEDVFAAVTAEAGRVLGSELTNMIRFDPDGAGTVVGVWTSTGREAPVPVGGRFPLGGRNLTTLVFESGRPARIDYDSGASGPAADLARAWGIRAAVGVPINVEGRLWGVMCSVSVSGRPRPADEEARLAGFTELVATAIANAQARMDLRAYADEQAALRHVATLVARAARPEEVFGAVAAQVGRLLGVDLTAVGRYDCDAAVTGMGVWTVHGHDAKPGVRMPLGGKNVTTLVFETGRPARIDDYAGTSGPVVDVVREWGIRSSIGVPINVGGRLWGVMVVSSARGQPLPADTEPRLVAFTELVATAIANAEGQAQLIASRARLVAASDGARRRIEQDLDDGAHQLLLTLVRRLHAARSAVPPRADKLAAKLDELAAEATSMLDELHELASGIHPAVLSDGGLAPALQTLAHRCTVTTRLDVRADRPLPEPIEIATYYLVAESLTNVVKHAHASTVAVEVDTAHGNAGDVLRVCVRDDGHGGANLAGGSGLVGLKDRVEALGGRLWVHTAAGAGTTVRAELPLSPTHAVPG